MRESLCCGVEETNHSMMMLRPKDGKYTKEHRNSPQLTEVRLLTLTSLFVGLCSSQDLIAIRVSGHARCSHYPLLPPRRALGQMTGA
jgi:hypothetical protein